MHVSNALSLLIHTAVGVSECLGLIYVQLLNAVLTLEALAASNALLALLKVMPGRLAGGRVLALCGC